MSEPEVCLANINAAGRRRRLVLGVVVLAATTAGAYVVLRDHGVLWGLVGIPPLAFGWLCVIQALENTCVVLAARGTRETDDGTAPVEDAALVAALRKRARNVYLKVAVITFWIVAFVAISSMHLFR